VALNVDPVLEDFEVIVPCGMRDGIMTSLSRERGEKVFLEQVRGTFVRKVGEVFNKPHAPTSSDVTRDL